MEVSVTVSVTVSVGPGAAQGARMTRLLSSVTAPFLANTRPCTVAPVVIVALVKARMVPTNIVVVPSVAELPTCQNTLQA